MTLALPLLVLAALIAGFLRLGWWWFVPRHPDEEMTSEFLDESDPTFPEWRQPT